MTRPLRLMLVSCVVLGNLPGFLHAEEPQYEALLAEAEQYYAECSYAKAREAYAKAAALAPALRVGPAWPAPDEARWIDFRLADCSWRAQAATETSDSTVYDQARAQLESLVQDDQRRRSRFNPLRGRLWAEVQESLGDFFWVREDFGDWAEAWKHYEPALDWWARASVIELARERYLAMIWKIAKSDYAYISFRFGFYGDTFPIRILENAARIAIDEHDRGLAHYLLALAPAWRASQPALRVQRASPARYEPPQNRRPEHRVAREFEAALELGKGAEWYDDALSAYADWLSGDDDFTLWFRNRNKPIFDHPKAVLLYKQLLHEFKESETPHYESAQRRIQEITDPVLSLKVSNIFLPSSQIEYYLDWRNIKRIDLALYRIDLAEDVHFSSRADLVRQWLPYVDVKQRTPYRSWSKDTHDRDDHVPVEETLQLEDKLPQGAYILTAQGGGLSARELVLVSDAAIVLKTAGSRVVVYFCDALDGSPIADAPVTLWQVEKEWGRLKRNAKTDQNGLCEFRVPKTKQALGLFVSARSKDRQAFAIGYSYRIQPYPEHWRTYVFSDRPAYRPNETVQWKIIARLYTGSTNWTPAHETLRYEITGPRGSKINEGSVKLNTFGSAWGALELTESMRLGEYSIRLYHGADSIGGAKLFRIEEFKLPEFKVSVSAPRVDGKPKVHRLGDTIEVTIQAEYYFGGAVAGADVEALVYKKKFHHRYRPGREYPWFYRPDFGRGQGRGMVLKRETLKTDATGKATLTFDAPNDYENDYEFTIEAHVTDASRREIKGVGTVRVTRQRYSVYPTAEHNLYLPRDTVSINIKALDANDEPVAVEGTVRVSRDHWHEVWIDPNGREVKDVELQRIRDAATVFPPPRLLGKKPWHLKFRGYRHDDILTRQVTTNAEGAAKMSFTPTQEGYYRVAWTSTDQDGALIEAETAVWVSTTATVQTGYHADGVEIILDKDTYRAGQTAAVIISTATSGRCVLYSVEGTGLDHYELIRMDGNLKLLHVPITENDKPNIYVGATMVSNYEIFTASKEIVVPPVEQFLDVVVKIDREEYQPQEEATLTITTRDHDGQPVLAEVAIGLVDESVYYIQEDYAGDPRRLFSAYKRPRYVGTRSTFQHKPYAHLEPREMPPETDELAANDYGINSSLSSLVLTASGGGASGGGGGGGGSRAGWFADLDAADLVDSLLGSPSTDDTADLDGDGGAVRDQAPMVHVRHDFRATAFWQPDIVTDRTGKASVKVKFPDSLTRWKATARAATEVSQFGIADTTARTTMPLIVRLQAPRFFVVGDTTTVSAIVNNNTDEDLHVDAALHAQGLTVSGGGVEGSVLGEGRSAKSAVLVPARGEARVDWIVQAEHAGSAYLRTTAIAGSHADAMERSYPVHEHGIEKFVSKSGKVHGDEVTIRLDIPAERRPESTALVVQVTPSLAVTMLDALPYLIDYPYGCTEQTMSRFLPAAITAKTLKDLGLDPETAMSKVFGGIEPAHLAKTHPGGKTSLHKLDAIIQVNLQRLYDMRHGDGGWGWWKEGESDPFMTAYVVWGLCLARSAEIDVNKGALDYAVRYLDQEIVKADGALDLQAWMLHALSSYNALPDHAVFSVHRAQTFRHLWSNRDRLNTYSRALLALSAHYLGKADEARILVENLHNGVTIDHAPDTSRVRRGVQQTHEGVVATAHWGEDGIYGQWSNGGAEATAFALRALVAINPQDELIEPVTNWLIRNRRGAQWSNTRDTAIVILALNAYLRQSGELEADLEYELLVNGESIATQKVTAADVLSAPSRFSIDPQYIRDGENEIRIRRLRGTSPLYFSADVRFFSLEEPVQPAGNEIFVRREYFKLVGRPTLLKGFIHDTLPLYDGEPLTSGQRLQAVITIESKNNYEYLVFEDLKPAGLETVQIRSGGMLYARELKSGTVRRRFREVEQRQEAEEPLHERTRSVHGTPARAQKNRDRQGTNGATDPGDYTGRTQWVYQQLHDRKVVLFIDRLPEGVWEIRYDLRAEVPGEFHALPSLGHAMYVPEIRCNGAETYLRIIDTVR